MKLSRITRLAFVITAVVIATSSGAGGSLAHAVSIVPPALSWHQCDARFQCASLRVPIDYAAPSKGDLSLALVEFPSSSPHPVGDLVMNPGGPGGSGVQLLEGSTFPTALHDAFNLVSFDPRGVGESDPVECVGPATLRSLAAENPAPTTARQIAVVVNETKAFDLACAAHTPKLLLENVGTLDTVRDLDAIRAALGQQKLNYLGFSYGTYIGELYAQEFPTRVRSMVLDGVIDPALSVAAEEVQQAEAFEGDLNDFFAWCPGNKSCAQELPHGAKASYGALLGGLSTGAHLTAPLKPQFGGTQTVTLGLAEIAVAGTLYSPQSWPDLAQAISQALDGNGGFLAAIAYSYEGLMQSGQYSNMVAASTAISCEDRPYPTKLSAYESLASKAGAVSPDFGAGEAWSSLACAYWPVPADAAPAAIHATGSPPILLIGSTGDPATPYRWAQSVAKELGHAELLTRQGPGHTGYLFSACIQRWTNRYLSTLALPPAHTVCTSNQ